MPVLITGVEPASPALRAGVRPGELLHAVNGHPIADVLDYRFYIMERRLVLSLSGKDGLRRTVRLTKGEYDDPGLTFDSYLMDKQRRCKNKCIFCFVDQMPKGLRESLYFKDDDSRMSFFFGSYVTLTNMTEADIRRIIAMHLSPINISVHATDPELRVKMLRNPRAGEVLRYLPMLAEAGIALNTQLVLCPGINDGEQLERSLNDLSVLLPALQSIALVPVGLTVHREGLYPLRKMTREEALRTLEIADAFNERMRPLHGRRIAFPADELFLTAGVPIPDADFYGDFDQLEDGVGLLALQRRDFLEKLEALPGSDAPRTVSVAFGTAAAPFMRELIARAAEKFPRLTVHVYAVSNRLFGETVDVTGLLCGRDLIDGLRGKPLGETLILSHVMLRHENTFLDDLTPADVEAALGVPVTITDETGSGLLCALAGLESQS